MKIGEAKAIAGGLGHPSKMPGTSYGISAHKCITGSKLVNVPGSVCHGCYALKANYRYQSVAIAHEKRLAGLSNPRWVEAMVELIHHSGAGWHRWHDSGDLQSVEHLALIALVAINTPKVRHWLPTRELGIVKTFVNGGGVIPDNLMVRVSATMIDGPATKAWPYTSEVHSFEVRKGARLCPAPKQNNNCGNCRACWSKSVACVSYHKH